MTELRTRRSLLASSIGGFVVKHAESSDFARKFIVLGAGCVGLGKEVGNLVVRLVSPHSREGVSVEGGHEAVTEEANPVGAVDGFSRKSSVLLAEPDEHRQHRESNDECRTRDADP